MGETMVLVNLKTLHWIAVSMDARHYRLMEQSSRLKLLGVTSALVPVTPLDFSSTQLHAMLMLMLTYFSHPLGNRTPSLKLFQPGTQCTHEV